MTNKYTEQINQAIEILNRTGNFKVIEKFDPEMDLPYLSDAPEGSVVACIVDIESTGTDILHDEIIELALVKFAFDKKTSEFLGVLDEFQSYEEPSIPISEEASKINGLYIDDVKGHRIDDELVEEFMADVVLCIAHNAYFDRAMTERRLAVFKQKHWACSQREIPWIDFDINGLKLEYIAYKLGFYYDAHRAETDCKALLHALSSKSTQEKTALAHLIENARKTTYRLWATLAPFESKELLKAKDYKFSDGSIETFEKKVWFKSFDTEEEIAAELEWLAKNVYMKESSVLVEKMTAKERFSFRRGPTQIRTIYF